MTKFSSSVPEGEGSVVPLVNPLPGLARPVVPDAAGELTEVPEVSLQADCQGVGRVQERLGTDSPHQDIGHQAREGAQRAVGLVLGLVVDSDGGGVGLQHETVVPLAVIVRPVVAPGQVKERLLEADQIKKEINGNVRFIYYWI